jgi:hypothetical protein
MDVVQQNMRCDHEFDFFKSLRVMGCLTLVELSIPKTGELG